MAASTGAQAIRQYDDWATLLIAAARRRDAAKRLEMYAQAEEILVNTDAAIIPLYWYTRNTVTKPYVIRTFALGGHEDFFLWDIAQ